jgi:hypothetical protein
VGEPQVDQPVTRQQHAFERRQAGVMRDQVCAVKRVIHQAPGAGRERVVRLAVGEPDVAGVVRRRGDRFGMFPGHLISIT